MDRLFPRICLALLVGLGLGFVLADEPVAEETEADKKAGDKVARIAEIEVRVDGTEDPHAPMPFGPKKLNYYGFLNFVKEAAADPELDAVILRPRSYGVGWARLLEVRDALKHLRASGKKVFVFMESLTTPDLVIASVADRISLPESGSVFLPGLATESLYMKQMLAKVRIRFDVIHIGDYKSAGESLVRDSMSKELRESLDPILDEFFESMVNVIAEGRGIEPAKVKEAIDRGILNAKAAHAAGLIDRIEYEDEFKDGVRNAFPGRKVVRAGKYAKKKGLGLDANNPMAAFSMIFSSMLGGNKEPDVKGPKVAVIYCTGAITSGKSQYDWQGNIASMGSETIVKAIDKARKNDDIKAIVLRINSPGGSGLASDMIWRAIERAKERKPVVSSMGDVAASGGYYIAMNSRAIFAEPQTITGSIGVVGMVPNVDDLYPWLGIRPERLTRGKRAAAFMTTKGLSDEDKATLRTYMEEFYGDFVAKVAAGRKKTPAEIQPIAQGRIWSGRTALKLGLIDRLGGLEDAIAHARTEGGIAADAEFHVVEYPRRGGPFDAFQEMLGVRLGLDAAVLARMPAVQRVLSQLAVLQRVAQDRICVIHPELSSLTTPFVR